ncbi:acetyltransferase [Streptomyces sp. NBC_00669]|uniref:GNAT family N-acetyltransferase n=1 Tax=unclassified Streptomyces TaxID=2593676 RepID=UPI002E345C9A|nr:GNAT family N-acetyltransferase [Streptomyces sp. NBC_00669]
MPSADSSTEDTLDLKLPPEVLALFSDSAVGEPTGGGGAAGAAGGVAGGLLDGIAAWPAAETPAGPFRLVPVVPDRDLAVLTRWMNDPAVAEFWELAGEQRVTEAHVRAQLDGDGRSVPCLGVLDGSAMSYWEVYRADLDPIARYYPARPHDTGVHLLIGGVADRARGLGGTLLRAVSDLVLDHRSACGRVIAEPDLRNTPSVAAFLAAGFRLSAEVDLPGKRAALMIRDRALRHRV